MARRLMELGRHDEAMAELEKGLKLDPQSWDLNKAAAFMLFKQSKNREAAERYEKAVAVMETDYHGWGMLLSCYQSLDDPRTEQAARMTLEQSERLDVHGKSAPCTVAMAMATATIAGSARSTPALARARSAKTPIVTSVAA